MSRSPRRGRISPLPDTKTENPQENEETSEEEDASQEVDETANDEAPHEGEVTQPEPQGETTMATIDLETASEMALVKFIETAFDRLSMEHLVSVIATAQEKREEKQAETRNLLIEKFRAQAEAAGMPFESLFPSSSRRKSRDGGSTVAVKYRGPNDETWSGRGMKAKWITDLEAQGRDIEEFRVT